MRDVIEKELVGLINPSTSVREVKLACHTISFLVIHKWKDLLQPNSENLWKLVNEHQRIMLCTTETLREVILELCRQCRLKESEAAFTNYVKVYSKTFMNQNLDPTELAKHKERLESYAERLGVTLEEAIDKAFLLAQSIAIPVHLNFLHVCEMMGYVLLFCVLLWMCRSGTGFSLVVFTVYILIITTTGRKWEWLRAGHRLVGYIPGAACYVLFDNQERATAWDEIFRRRGYKEFAKID